MQNKVYISDSSLNNMIRARKHEIAREWIQARELRKREEQTDDVAAIDLIIESTRLGDEYRRLTRGAFEEYENRKINIYQFNEILNNAWKQVYGEK